MTAFQLAQKIRSYTKQTSVSLPDATLLPMVNDAKNEMAELIASRDIKGNFFIVPSLTNLIANQREYAFPDDQLNHIFSIEVAFSSTTDTFGQLPYVAAFPDDFRRLGLARTEANIQANYTNGSTGSFLIDAYGSMNGASGPRYEIQRRSVYLLSGSISSTAIGGSTVSNGIRLRYRAYPADLTQLTDNSADLSIDPSTTTFGFPKQFHELWARRVSVDWKSQHPGAVPPSQLDTSYLQDFENKLSGVEENDLSGEIIGRLPRQTGWDL